MIRPFDSPPRAAVPHSPYTPQRVCLSVAARIDKVAKDAELSVKSPDVDSNTRSWLWKLYETTIKAFFEAMFKHADKR
jgi:hypothetical protein